jgi:branched-chain amino acid transport system substrate-binding protein
MGRKIRNGLAAGAIFALVAALAGCGGGSAAGPGGSSGRRGEGNGDGEFTVLFIGDQSGPLKTIGINILDALKAGADYLNATGGVNGEQVKIIAENDNGDPQTSVQELIKYLSSNEAPDVVWSGIEGNSTSALLPVIAQHELFSFGTQDGSDLLGEGHGEEFPYQFAALPPIQVPDELAAEYIAEQGVKKIGFAEEEAAIAESEEPFLLKALEAEGIETTIAKMPATATDVTPQIDELKSSGAELLYYNGVAENVGYGFAARAKLGWDVPVLGALPAAAVDPTSLASKEELEGVDFVNFKVTDAAEEVPHLKTVEKYLAKYGGVQGVGMNTITLAWDALMAAANATEQAGSTEPAALAEALENVKEPKSERYVTVPEYSWTKTDHEPKITPAVHEAYVVMGAGPMVEGRIHPYAEGKG